MTTKRKNVKPKGMSPVQKPKHIFPRKIDVEGMPDDGKRRTAAYIKMFCRLNHLQHEEDY